MRSDVIRTSSDSLVILTVIYRAVLREYIDNLSAMLRTLFHRRNLGSTAMAQEKHGMDLLWQSLANKVSRCLLHNIV